MKPPSLNDLDYLGAVLHARRSRIAEAGRLEALCRLRSLAELGRAVYPDTEFPTAADFQRRLVEDWARELSDCMAQLGGAVAKLLAWLSVRFEVENLKVVLRGVVNRIPFEQLKPRLIPLPQSPTWDVEALAHAQSLTEFVGRLPRGWLRQTIREAVKIYPEEARTFFLEAVLDREYFHQLMARMDALSRGEKAYVRPLIVQEVDTFHLMLALRGRFHYGLTPEALLPLHLGGTSLPVGRFAAMLSDSEPFAAAARTLGRVIDVLPGALGPESVAGTSELTVFEGLARTRYLRLANRAFRCSHLGCGAIIGYFAVRRMEVANLITVSEALKLEVGAEDLAARLTPRTKREASYA